MDNNIDGELTTGNQYNKFGRAMRIVFQIDLTAEDYRAILQLMNELPSTATLVLDETHEDIT